MYIIIIILSFALFNLNLTASNSRNIVLSSAVINSLLQETIHDSDSPTDIAIVGQGYFVLVDPKDKRKIELSRVGRFYSHNGYLSSISNNKRLLVKDTHGKIKPLNVATYFKNSSKSPGHV